MREDSGRSLSSKYDLTGSGVRHTFSDTFPIDTVFKKLSLAEFWQRIQLGFLRRSSDARRFLSNRARACLTLAVLFVIAILPERVTIPVTAQQNSTITPDVPNLPPGSAYHQTNFISDSPGLATILDPLLRNPWGIASGATSPLWVVNNATSTTQLVRGDVGGVPLTLNPGLQTVNIPGGSPTGIVANATTDFKIMPPGGGTLAAANFIFASETGNITAWNGAQGTTATNVVSMLSHKWTGLAIGANAGGNRLYAADFANNHIDVFDGTFMATTVSGGFIDATIPAGFSVFNIQNLGGSLYVTYAKINMAGDDVVNGSGLGLVRKFDTDGVRDPMFAINNGSRAQRTVGPGDCAGLFRDIWGRASRW